MSGSQPIGHGVATLPASQFSANPAPVIAPAPTAARAAAAAPASGSTLSLAQVVTLCLNHTGDTTRVGRACLIAWCESGFRSNAVNTTGNTPPSRDRGLFQINSFWHPEITDAEAFDAVRNTTAAFHISGGFVNFSQWATRIYLPGGSAEHTSKGQAAARIMANAIAEAKAQLSGEKGPSPWTAAAGSIGGAIVGGADVIGGAAGDIGNAVMSVPDFLAKLSQGHTWLRVLQVVGGVAAVAAGAFLLSRDLITAPLGDAAALAATHSAAAL